MPQLGEEEEDLLQKLVQDWVTPKRRYEDCLVNYKEQSLQTVLTSLDWLKGTLKDSQGYHFEQVKNYSARGRKTALFIILVSKGEMATAVA